MLGVRHVTPAAGNLGLFSALCHAGRGRKEVNCPNRNCFINSPSRRGRAEGGKEEEKKGRGEEEVQRDKGMRGGGTEG